MPPTKKSEVEDDFYKFRELIKATTENLKKLNELQAHWRYQFDHPEWYEEFIKELTETQEGWVSSHC